MRLAYVRVAVICWVVYLILTANLQPVNIVIGLLVGVAVALMVKPDSPPPPLSQLPSSLFNLARYSVWLTGDIIRNGVKVARMVLDPKLPIRPGIVAIPSGMASELGTALSAHAITITPGEQVIEIGDDGTMYTHCLDAVGSAEGAAEAQRTRRAMLEKIFE